MSYICECQRENNKSSKKHVRMPFVLWLRFFKQNIGSTDHQRKIKKKKRKRTPHWPHGHFTGQIENVHGPVYICYFTFLLLIFSLAYANWLLVLWNYFNQSPFWTLFWQTNRYSLTSPYIKHHLIHFVTCPKRKHVILWNSKTLWSFDIPITSLSAFPQWFLLAHPTAPSRTWEFIMTI